MPISGSSRDSSSGSLGGSVGTSTDGGGPGWDFKSSSVFRYLLGCPEQLVQLSPCIKAQAIRFVWRYSSQVFSCAQVCSSTKPHPSGTSTVRSNQSPASSLHGRFRSLPWVVSVKETNGAGLERFQMAGNALRRLS